MEDFVRFWIREIQAFELSTTQIYFYPQSLYASELVQFYVQHTAPKFLI